VVRFISYPKLKGNKIKNKKKVRFFSYLSLNIIKKTNS